MSYYYFWTNYYSDRDRPHGPIIHGENNNYGSFVCASSIFEAETLCIRRNLGERLSHYGGQTIHRPRGNIPPSMMLDAAPPMECVHAAVFLCYIALQSGVSKVHEILGDDGVLHALVHYYHLKTIMPGWTTKEYMIEKLRQLEAKVPGYLPPQQNDYANVTDRGHP